MDAANANCTAIRPAYSTRSTPASAASRVHFDICDPNPTAAARGFDTAHAWLPISVLAYPHHRWDASWEGATEFVRGACHPRRLDYPEADDAPPILAIAPLPHRTVVFSSDLLHRLTPPSEDIDVAVDGRPGNRFSTVLRMLCRAPPPLPRQRRRRAPSGRRRRAAAGGGGEGGRDGEVPRVSSLQGKALHEEWTRVRDSVGGESSSSAVDAPTALGRARQRKNSILYGWDDDVEGPTKDRPTKQFGAKAAAAFKQNPSYSGLFTEGRVSAVGDVESTSGSESRRSARRGTNNEEAGPSDAAPPLPLTPARVPPPRTSRRRVPADESVQRV